jgi:hypothetical protein
VGRWDEVIDRAVNAIGSETFGAPGYREIVGHYLFDAECAAADQLATDINEKVGDRVNDMQEELEVKLRGRRKAEPENKIWELAITLLNLPYSRAAKHQWPPHV